MGANRGATPAQPVADHIRTLLAAGASWRLMARHANCSMDSIHAILHGRPTITRALARRLMALRIEDVISSNRSVSAIGLTRRIRALHAIGHTLRVIQADSDVDKKLISTIACGKTTAVRIHNAERLISSYKRLSRIPGTNERARQRAKAEGWPGPMAWDDIDDPKAQPELDNARDTGAADPVEVERYLSTGQGRVDAATLICYLADVELEQAASLAAKMHAAQVLHVHRGKTLSFTAVALATSSRRVERWKQTGWSVAA
jgi:hypothetical protein